MPISSPVLCHFCSSLEVACLHEETVWNIASINISLGLWWVTSEKVRDGFVRFWLQPTRWDDNRTSLFLSIHTNTQTHTSLLQTWWTMISSVVPMDVSLVWFSAPKTELSPMSGQCFTFPWTPVCLWLCCSVVRSVASSFSPHLCVSVLPLFLCSCMMNPHVHVIAAWSTVMDAYWYILL